MNELQKSERKRRIVFKKAILVMIYLVILFFVYVGISAYVSLNTIALFLGTVIFMSITLPRLFGYVQRSYHCVPYFNEIFTKKELEDLFEQEMFSDIVFL
jgi:amino acid permease